MNYFVLPKLSGHNNKKLIRPYFKNDLLGLNAHRFLLKKKRPIFQGRKKLWLNNLWKPAEASRVLQKQSYSRSRGLGIPKR